MKKFFTIIAAVVLGSTAAFAQEENPFMSITPGYGATLDSRNTTVTIAPTPMGSIFAPGAAGVLVQGIAGQGFNQLPMEPVFYPFEGGVAAVQLTDASWALPYFEVYYLQLFVVFADATGTPIYSEDLEDYVMGITAYKTPDNNPAAWAKNYPSERNFTDEGLTFKRFYEAGTCTFYFTKKVTLPDDAPIGYILYADKAGNEEGVEIENFEADWASDLGLFAITVNISNPEFTVNNLASIEVVLEGVENGNNEEISVPAIYAENTTSPQAAPRKSKSKEECLVSGNETVNVYNVQGIIVKENVSANAVKELPAGMYIVNGKKVLVR